MAGTESAFDEHTAQWGVMTLAGPNARVVLQRAVDDTDVSNEALPALGVKDATI